jgi:recombination protein RecT
MSETKQNPGTSPVTAATTNSAAVQQQPGTDQPTIGEKFLGMVTKELVSINKGAALTDFQQRLAQNYFIKIDTMLKDTDKKRLAKSENYREPLSLTWNNVNLPKLALDVVAFSAVGLDPLQPNHVNFIPYKNNALSKYDIGFIIGYRGCELKAKKYGLDIPDDVVIELVYQNDKFKQIKKDANNTIETYYFEVLDDFNRGELIGGFYYYVYNDRPERNKIRVFTKKDIEKRRPTHASPEFWGGEKPTWQNGQKVGTEIVEGWQEEMWYKTIYRAAYNNLTIDSQKIDDKYQTIIAAEQSVKEADIQNEIDLKANKTEIGFAEVVPATPVVIPQPQQQPIPQNDGNNPVDYPNNPPF